MAKVISIIEIQEEINKLNIMKNESLSKIADYERMNTSEKDNYIRNIRREYIDKENKNIDKCNFNIEKSEYQISIGGRKLKTNITISKELVNAGFSKQTYIASPVRNCGCTVGDFKVTDNPTQIIINYGSYKKDNFEKFLVEKYGNDVSIQDHNVIVINK